MQPMSIVRRTMSSVALLTAVTVWFGGCAGPSGGKRAASQPRHSQRASSSTRDAPSEGARSASSPAVGVNSFEPEAVPAEEAKRIGRQGISRVTIAVRYSTHGDIFDEGTGGAEAAVRVRAVIPASANSDDWFEITQSGREFEQKLRDADMPGGLNLLYPGDREYVVRTFVDVFGIERARKMRLYFCDTNGRLTYRWPRVPTTHDR